MEFSAKDLWLHCFIMQGLAVVGAIGALEAGAPRDAQDLLREARDACAHVLQHFPDQQRVLLEELGKFVGRGQDFSVLAAEMHAAASKKAN